MLFEEHVFSGHLPHRHTDQVVSIFTLILKRLDLIQTVCSRTDTQNSESNHSAHYAFGCTVVRRSIHSQPPAPRQLVIT